jgi:hypothetical protein
MLRLNWLVGFTGALATMVATVQAQTPSSPDAVLEDSFSPYAKTVPHILGMESGGVISKKNLPQMREYLDPAMAEAVGNGWVEIAVRPARSHPVS